MQRKITEFIEIKTKRTIKSSEDFDWKSFIEKCYRREYRVVRVVGPPGTGKTRYLVNVANYFSMKGKKIVYLSLCRGAVEEFGNRSNIERHTLHSYCCKLLGWGHVLRQVRDVYSSDWSYVDEIRSRICRRYGFDYVPGDPESLGYYIFSLWDYYVHRFYHEYNDVNSVLDRFCSDCSEYCYIVEKYLKYLEEEGIPDFNDMIVEAFRREVKPSCNVLLVDEAQDFTPLEWSLLKLWVEYVDHMYFAGDDDQAIYTFRGADPSCFININPDYEITLGQSYRVPVRVWKLANAISNNISNRLSKKYEPARRMGCIRYFSKVYDVLREASKLWEKFHGEVSIAVLARTKSIVERFKLMHQYYHNVDSSIIDPGYVRYGTIHSVKGQEYDVVVLVDGVTRKIEPYLDHQGWDDEYRVWYVAVTRTREYLFVIDGTNVSDNVTRLIVSKFLSRDQ